MIKFEDARAEISKRKGIEAPKQIKSVMELFLIGTILLFLGITKTLTILCGIRIYLDI